MTVKTEPSPDPDADPEADPAPPAVRKVLERVRKRVHRDGSAEYLAVARWCVEQRCKIWGFDAATKVQILGAVAVKVEAAQPQGLTADDLAFLADLADRCNILGPAPAAEPGGVPPGAPHAEPG